MSNIRKPATATATAAAVAERRAASKARRHRRAAGPRLCGAVNPDRPGIFDHEAGEAITDPITCTAALRWEDGKPVPHRGKHRSRLLAGIVEPLGGRVVTGRDPAVDEWATLTMRPDTDLTVEEAAHLEQVRDELAWWSTNWGDQPEAAHQVFEDVFEATTRRRPGVPDRHRAGADESVWCRLGPLMGDGATNGQLHLAAVHLAQDGPLTWDEALTARWSAVIACEAYDRRDALIALASTAVLWAETLPHEGRRAGR